MAKTKPKHTAVIYIRIPAELDAAIEGVMAKSAVTKTRVVIALLRRALSLPDDPIDGALRELAESR